MVNDSKPLTIFTKRSMSDVWEGSEYASVNLCYLCSNNILIERPIIFSVRHSQKDIEILISDGPWAYRIESLMSKR